MARNITIRIGEAKIISTRPEIKKFKAILDKLELPYTMDDISFHNTFLDLHRLKTIHNTNIWKVEKDGSLSLTNRFGHSSRYNYEHLEILSLLEFQFVNLGNLNTNEMQFLDDLLYRVECETGALMPGKRKIDELYDSLAG